MPVPLIPSVTLNNGVSMPQFGLGVWQAQEGGEVELAVRTALKTGYRLIDTAAVYGNEVGVGMTIRSGGIPREELFITTKVWNDRHGYDETLEAFDQSLARLGLNYIDLYLIHWPMPRQGKMIETWQALETLYANNRVRVIGVSNFTPVHLQELLETCTVVPMVNQIELHPKFQQYETREFCARHDIQIESYSPLMRGGELLNDPVLLKLADKHQKTPAQIVLRWHIQNGFVVIPKSVTPARIEENVSIFDFVLDEDDMAAIAAMDEGIRIGIDPDAF